MKIVSITESYALPNAVATSVLWFYKTSSTVKLINNFSEIFCQMENFLNKIKHKTNQVKAGFNIRMNCHRKPLTTIKIEKLAHKESYKNNGTRLRS